MFIKSNIFISVFLCLLVIATIYPPFIWGEERLRTSEERYELKHYSREAYDALPLKKYDFLFSSSKQQFQFGWGWNEYKKESYPFILSLQRRLDFSELALEYILSFLFAIIIDFVVTHTRRVLKKS